MGRGEEGDFGGQFSDMMIQLNHWPSLSVVLGLIGEKSQGHHDPTG